MCRAHMCEEPCHRVTRLRFRLPCGWTAAALNVWSRSTPTRENPGSAASRPGATSRDPKVDPTGRGARRLEGKPAEAQRPGETRGRVGSIVGERMTNGCRERIVQHPQRLG